VYLQLLICGYFVVLCYFYCFVCTGVGLLQPDESPAIVAAAVVVVVVLVVVVVVVKEYNGSLVLRLQPHITMTIAISRNVVSP
jgi:hypothetical protein